MASRFGRNQRRVSVRVVHLHLYPVYTKAEIQRWCSADLKNEYKHYKKKKIHLKFYGHVEGRMSSGLSNLKESTEKASDSMKQFSAACSEVCAKEEQPLR